MGLVWDAIRHPHDSATKSGKSESSQQMRGFLSARLGEPLQILARAEQGRQSLEKVPRSQPRNARISSFVSSRSNPSFLHCRQIRRPCATKQHRQARLLASSGPRRSSERIRPRAFSRSNQSNDHRAAPTCRQSGHRRHIEGLSLRRRRVQA